MNQIDISIAEAVLRYAVIENHKEEMKQLEEDINPVPFSDAHEKRMRRLFARARAKRAAIRVWAISRKAVTAAALVIAVLSSVLMFNPRVQAAVTEVITEFFAQFTNFRFNSAAEEPMGNVEWELRWLPESFSETYRGYDEGVSRAGYANSDGVTIRFTANPTEDNQINVDNENADYSVKTKDGIEYYIFASTSEDVPSTIIWVYQGYDFFIRSHCDVGTLEKIAYSLHKAD